jgi:hypothetical protein
MILTGETQVLGEKPLLVPLCPPQISHELAWYRTRATAMQGGQLIALTKLNYI